MISCSSQHFTYAPCAPGQYLMLFLYMYYIVAMAILNDPHAALGALNQAVSSLHETFDDMGINPEVNQLNDIDPDLNCLAHSFSQYYLENDFSSKFAHDPLFTSGFSVFNLNVRSIPKNFDSLTDYLKLLDFRFSVISLSETWLTTNNCNNYHIPDYVSHHVNRVNRRGGGVSVYIHSSYTFNARTDLDLCNDNIECACIEICSSPLASYKPIIISVYRPPNSDPDSFMESLSSILNKVKIEKKLCYVSGDFNFDLLKIDCNPFTAKFLDLLQSFSFRPLIDRPTRITPSSSTLIDNIFCNDLLSDISSGLFYTSISDHLPIFALLPGQHQDEAVPKTYTTTEYTPANKAKFSEFLMNETWYEVYQCSDAHTAFNVFNNKINTYYNNAFPIVTKSTQCKRSKPWLSTALRKSIKVKNTMYVQFHKYPTVANEVQYKAYKSHLQRLLSLAKKSYYQSQLLINKTNPRKTWNILRNLMGSNVNKDRNISQIKHEGKIITDKPSIVNKLNSHFTSIGVKLSEKIPPSMSTPLHYLDGNYVNSFYLSPVLPNDVSNCILHLKINSSPGHDRINPSVVKDNCVYIVQPLTHVINLSLSQGYVPQEWKVAHVTPVFKTGERDNMSNYRPISVLPVFSKILERIVYNKLFKYLNDHNILSKHQFGFRSGHSTEMPLTIALDRITKALDQRQHAISVFLDLQKAFDVVNHSFLLKKLEFYGVRGVSLEWFRSYLYDRSQIVKLDNSLSDRLPIQCGVPQGSILGPLLFLLFINDLCNLPLSMYPLLFADDTTLLCSSSNVNNLIDTVNHDLDVLSKWFSTNKLLLNVKKTQFMLFSLNNAVLNRNVHIAIDNCAINRVTSTKFLGVIIDCKLTWSEHITHVSKKVSKSIGIINKIKNIVDDFTLRQLYNSLIYPYFMYCHVVWGNCNKTNLSRLILLQKKIIRIITNSTYLAHTDPLFTNLRIIKIQNLYTYVCSIIIYKLIRGIFPLSFASTIDLRLVHHNVNTRSNRSKYYVPFCRTSLRQRSLSYSLPKLTNEFFMPHNLDVSTSIFDLKKKLRLFLT